MHGPRQPPPSLSLGSLGDYTRMIPKCSIWFVAAVSLLAGCARNAIWTTPDSYSMPLALATPSVKTGEFTHRSARYGVYLVHHTPCSVTHLEHPAHVYERYNAKIDCDIAITIRRWLPDGPILFERHTTKARLAMESNDEASYDLGYFETAERGKLAMVVSNAPSRHDDSACHAHIEVCELLRK